MRMRANIRREGKLKKTTEFVERMKNIQEEAEVALRKAQEKIKRQIKKEKKLRNGKRKIK